MIEKVTLDFLLGRSLRFGKLERALGRIKRKMDNVEMGKRSACKK